MCGFHSIISHWPASFGRTYLPNPARERVAFTQLPRAFLPSNFHLFFKRFYLFLKRGEGREKEREKYQ